MDILPSQHTTSLKGLHVNTAKIDKGEASAAFGLKHHAQSPNGHKHIQNVQHEQTAQQYTQNDEEMKQMHLLPVEVIQSLTHSPQHRKSVVHSPCANDQQKRNSSITNAVAATTDSATIIEPIQNESQKEDDNLNNPINNNNHHDLSMEKESMMSLDDASKELDDFFSIIMENNILIRFTDPEKNQLQKEKIFIRERHRLDEMALTATERKIEQEDNTADDKINDKSILEKQKVLLESILETDYEYVEEKEVEKTIEESSEKGVQELKELNIRAALVELKRAENVVSSYVQGGGRVMHDRVLHVLANLGLCYYKIGLLDEALMCLENCLVSLKFPPNYVIVNDDATDDDDQNALKRQEDQQDQQAKKDNQKEDDENEQENAAKETNSKYKSQFLNGNIDEQLKYLQKKLSKFKNKKIRCSLHMQCCIILSELRRHEDSLVHSRFATKLAYNCLSDAVILLHHEYFLNQKSKVQQTNSNQVTSNNEADSFSLGSEYSENVIKIMSLADSKIMKTPYLIYGSNMEIARDKEFKKLRILNYLQQQNCNQNQNSPPNMACILDKLPQTHLFYRTSILGYLQLRPYDIKQISQSAEWENELGADSMACVLANSGMSLYCASTELRFLEEATLGAIADQGGSLLESEIFLAKALEVLYTFIHHDVPFVNQIMQIYVKFHNQACSVIPEDDSATFDFLFLRPLKGVAKNPNFIPIIRLPPTTNFQITMEMVQEFDQQQKELEKEEVLKNTQINTPCIVLPIQSKALNENEKNNTDEEKQSIITSKEDNQQNAVIIDKLEAVTSITNVPNIGNPIQTTTNSTSNNIISNSQNLSRPTTTTVVANISQQNLNANIPVLNQPVKRAETNQLPRRPMRSSDDKQISKQGSMTNLKHAKIKRAGSQKETRTLQATQIQAQVQKEKETLTVTNTQQFSKQKLSSSLTAHSSQKKNTLQIVNGANTMQQILELNTNVVNNQNSQIKHNHNHNSHLMSELEKVYTNGTKPLMRKLNQFNQTMYPSSYKQQIKLQHTMLRNQKKAFKKLNLIVDTLQQTQQQQNNNCIDKENTVEGAMLFKLNNKEDKIMSSSMGYSLNKVQQQLQHQQQQKNINVNSSSLTLTNPQLIGAKTQKFSQVNPNLNIMMATSIQQLQASLPKLHQNVNQVVSNVNLVDRNQRKKNRLLQTYKGSGNMLQSLSQKTSSMPGQGQGHNHKKNKQQKNIHKMIFVEGVANNNQIINDDKIATFEQQLNDIVEHGNQQQDLEFKQYMSLKQPQHSQQSNNNKLLSASAPLPLNLVVSNKQQIKSVKQNQIHYQSGLPQIDISQSAHGLVNAMLNINYKDYKPVQKKIKVKTNNVISSGTQQQQLAVVAQNKQKNKQL